jgi:hypothetical protein
LKWRKQAKYQTRLDFFHLFYPHWKRATIQGSLERVAKTAIPVQKVPRTTIVEWQLDLETLLDMPLNQRLQPRQANTPYVALFDYAMSGWQEDMLTQFLPLSSIYLDPFFYTTDQQGRLEVLGAFSLEVIPPEQWANRFKQITGIAENMKIIPFPGIDDAVNIPSLWKSYKRLPWN